MSEEKLIWEAYTSEASNHDDLMVNNIIDKVLYKAKHVGLDLNDDNIQRRLVNVIYNELPELLRNKDIDIHQKIKDRNISTENLNSNVQGGAILTVNKNKKHYLPENNDYEFDTQQDGTIRIYLKQTVEKNIGKIDPGGVVQDGSMKLAEDGKSITMVVHDNIEGLIGKTFKIPDGTLQNVFRVPNNS